MPRERGVAFRSFPDPVSLKTLRQSQLFIADDELCRILNRRDGTMLFLTQPAFITCFAVPVFP
jgi:hypothetical protein